MSPLAHEMRLLVRARLAMGALILLALLAAAGSPRVLPKYATSAQ